MPDTVDLELTNRCDLHCKMCWLHGECGIGDNYQGLELSTNEVFNLIDQVSKHKPQIYIGGAEPLFREDLFIILEYLKRHDLVVSFTTNGTLFDQRKIEMLVTLGIDHVTFSIDGDEKLHDQIRGEGTFKKVTSAIKGLSEYKKRRSSNRPAIIVNFTVTKDIRNHVYEAINAVKEATHDGADIYRIHHLWYITHKELSAHQSAVKQSLGCKAAGAGSHLISSAQGIGPHSLADEISLLKGQPKVTSFPDLSRHEIVNYYSESKSMKGRCIAPFFKVVIKPNGDVKFCPDEWIDDFVLGNIRHDRFDTIWNNDRARLFRKVLFKKKCFSGCRRCSWMYAR
jgi:radical SAM protein with 4Fe4S-binding SPASM domain